MDWEFCHPALENGMPAGIEYIHTQTQMAFEYLSALRAVVEQEAQATTAGQAVLLGFRGLWSTG
jgi:hypothetical protein